MGIFWCLMGAGVLLYCAAVRLRAGRMAFMRLVAAGGGLALLAGIWRILSPAGMLPRILSGLGLAALFALLMLEAANLLRIRALPRMDAAPDCTVVLGCGLRGGEAVSRTMEERLQAAYAAWEGETLVLSGGQSAREKYPEAEVMARWLAGRGVPADRLVLESRSRNTVQNLRFSAELLAREGKPVSKSRVRIVTNDFHAPRALSIARSLGYREVYILPARAGGIAAPLYHMRECGSQLVWWARKRKMERKGRA